MFPHKTHCFLKNTSKVKNKMRLREALRDWSYYTCEGGGWVTCLRSHRQPVVWLAFETSTNLICFPKPIYLFQRSETVFREASSFLDAILRSSNKATLVHWVFAPDYSFLSVRRDLLLELWLVRLHWLRPWPMGYECSWQLVFLWLLLVELGSNPLFKKVAYPHPAA